MYVKNSSLSLKYLFKNYVFKKVIVSKSKKINQSLYLKKHVETI